MLKLLVILLNKPPGLTPLQALDALRVQYPEHAKKKLAYAGRLDPMAEGLLLVLEDEECKKRDQFQGLDKVYEFDLLLGVSTDSGDILGLVNNFDPKPAEINFDSTVLAKFTGEIKLPYPAYSAKTVNGKKLFQLAKENNLPTELPSKPINIYSLKKLSTNIISCDALLEYIHKSISRVTGNFRQKEIFLDWQKLFNTAPDASFSAITLKAHVQSGTYIRSLCQELARVSNTYGLALRIKRVQIDQYSLSDALSIDVDQ